MKAGGIKQSSQTSEYLSCRFPVQFEDFITISVFFYSYAYLKNHMKFSCLLVQDNADKREWDLDRVRGRGQWHWIVIRKQSCSAGCIGGDSGDCGDGDWSGSLVP